MPARQLQPFVEVRLVDETASTADMRISVHRSTGRDAGMSGVQLLASLADAASSCTPTHIELHYPVAIQPPGVPAPGADRHRVGVLIFTTTDPDQFGIIEIFGITAACIDPDDPTRLLLTEPALDAYITALISGTFCNPFGYQLVACIAGLYELR